ncbi:hypothetical protein HYW87_03590, partial [Candidatus Roizmanbacteria bacterium]|nr:hypothetical protein [Candidatus Roizmanbacteria bacterium]
MKFIKRFPLVHLAVLLILILLFFVYFLKANIFLDPDFGWRLRIGEIILKNGIPKTDPLSYTMPSYQYADHEWLAHAAMAKLYSLFRYDGLALIFTFLAIGSVVIMIRNSDIRFAALHILFATTALFSYFGVRVQVITWLFFAIICRIILEEKWWSRLKYFLPFIFLLWANLHGGFIIGLVVLFIATFERKDSKGFAILLASIIATFINPYGIRLWREVAISLTDTSLRLLIIEWRPIFFSATVVLLLLMVYSLTFILRYRR